MKRKGWQILAELILVGSIMMCIIYMINSTHQTISDLTLIPNNSTGQCLVGGEDHEHEIVSSLGDYVPDSCKLAEVFDDQYNSILKLQFSTIDGYIDDESLLNHPEVVEICSSSTNGYAECNMGGTEPEHIYFQWLECEGSSTGDYLVLVVLNDGVRESVYHTNVVCCMIAFLVIVLFIMVLIERKQFAIQHYNLISKIGFRE